jgi:hypothetical protein
VSAAKLAKGERRTTSSGQPMRTLGLLMSDHLDTDSAFGQIVCLILLRFNNKT